MRSETVSTRLACRAACGTTRRKTARSLRDISSGSRSNERSWIVTTAGAGERDGQRVLRVDERRAARGGAAAAASRASAAPAPASRAAAARCRAGRARDGASTAAMRRPASAAGAGQLAQEVRDVALVAGALPAEHVGVDDDERAHATRPPVRGHGGLGRPFPGVQPRALEPERDELVTPPVGLVDAGGDRRGVERVDEHRPRRRRPPPSRSPRVVTTGVPHAIASAAGMPKPS